MDALEGGGNLGQNGSPIFARWLLPCASAEYPNYFLPLSRASLVIVPVLDFMSSKVRPTWENQKVFLTANQADRNQAGLRQVP